MLKSDNKKRGLTLVEVIIALVILTLVVVASLSSVTSLYQNAFDGRHVTEEVYLNKKNLEEMTYVIGSLNLQTKDDMRVLERKIDDSYSSKASDIKDKLTKLHCSYVPSIELFQSTYGSHYACKVDGFSLYSYSSKSSNKVKKLHSFVPNNGDFLKYYMLKNTYIKDNKNGDKKAVYNYALNTDALSSYYSILEDSKKYKDGFKYAKYTWQFAPRHQAGKVFEAVFDKNDKVPSAVDPNALYSLDFGSEISSAQARLVYPESSDYTESWVGSANFVPDFSKITDDGYLQSTVEMIYKFKYNGNPITYSYTSPPVFLINLPYMNNLIYHYSMDMEGKYVNPTKRTTKSIYELSQILDASYVNNGYNLKNGSASDFDIYSDGKYKFYKIPNSNESELSASTRGASSSDGKNEMTLFVIIDVENAESGTILQRKNSHYANKKYFCLEYDKGSNRVIYYSGPKNEGSYYNQNSIGRALHNQRHPVTNEVVTKHLVILKAMRVNIFDTPKKNANYRRNGLAVDNRTFAYKPMKKGWRMDSRDNYNALNNDSKLLLGGAKGLKVYEIIAYDEVLSNDNVSKIAKYLAKKYDMIDRY